MPDEITVELWKAQIDAAVNGHMFKPDIDVLVLDGIPRNVGQASIMDALIDVKRSSTSRAQTARRSSPG